MKAFVITSPGQTQVVDVPKPTPGPNDLLLKTRYIGLCGTDLNTFRGRNPMVTYPRIPGHEIAATIVDAGANVPRLPTRRRRHRLPLHQLRNLRIMPAWPLQRVP